METKATRTADSTGEKALPTQKWTEHSNEDARAANINEHHMTVREALRSYRWAIIWSLTVSMSVIMEGESSSCHISRKRERVCVCVCVCEPES